MRSLRGVVVAMALALAWMRTDAAILTWSAHNLTFEVPDGGTVTYNSASHFEIMWQDMALVTSFTVTNAQIRPDTGTEEYIGELEIKRKD